MKAHLATFREGWQSENLARFILSKFSFIANPSTISDDLGCDYFCTIFKILTENKKDYLIPKSSFSIQIKSNRKSIDISNKIEFLYNLETPYFIGVIDKRKLNLTIYSGECLPSFFAENGKPKNVHIKLCKNEVIAPHNYIHKDKSDNKYILRFPRLVDIGVQIKKMDLKKSIEIINQACSVIQKNIASKKSKEFIFDMYRFPKITKIFAGPGSAQVFRENLFKRLGEVFFNLKWIKENNPKDFRYDEFLLYEDFYKRIKQYYNNLPDYLDPSLISLIGLLKKGINNT